MISGKFRVKKNEQPYSDCICVHPELIENYDEAINDNTQMWICHHRLETHFSDGTPRPKDAQLSASELKALSMYFNRPPEELIFLNHTEHRNVHQKGKLRSQETIDKISASKMGHGVSDATRHKISKTLQKFYYQCVETNEVATMKEWISRGYFHVNDVASGKRKSDKGLHFITNTVF